MTAKVGRAKEREEGNWGERGERNQEGKAMGGKGWKFRHNIASKKLKCHDTTIKFTIDSIYIEQSKIVKSNDTIYYSKMLFAKIPETVSCPSYVCIIIDGMRYVKYVCLYRIDLMPCPNLS